MNNEHDFKPYDRVLVRGQRGMYWRTALYEKMHGNGDYYVVGGNVSYSQCIPYEGNEHLLGTNDEPKPARWAPKEGDTYWFLAWYGRGNCEVDYCSWDGSYTDIARAKSHNCFRTKEEAKDVAAVMDQAWARTWQDDNDSEKDVRP